MAFRPKNRHNPYSRKGTVLQWFPAPSPKPKMPTAQSSRDPPRAEPHESPSLGSVLERRPDAPPVDKYTRGSRELALAIASDPVRRTRAINHLEARRYSRAALGSRANRRELWRSILLKSGLPEPPQISAQAIFTGVAILVAAGYRSAIQVAEQAMLEARAADYPIPESAVCAIRDARRAARRGLGPPKHAAAFPLERAPALAQTQEPLTPLGPMWPATAILVGCWWLLREIELSNIVVSDITCTEDAVTINLSASKTDPTALGAQRTHKCACGSCPKSPHALGTDLCPACAVIRHLARLAALPFFSDHCPLFPTEAGEFPSKTAMVATIRLAAASLSLPSHSKAGAQEWGGHSLRRGGAQFLGRAGVEIWRIQALARHSSAAILLYLADAHVPATASIAAEAGYQRSLAVVQEQLQALQHRVNAASPLVHTRKDTAGVTTVWSPRAHSRVHHVSPADPQLTLCKWKWVNCLQVITNPPAPTAPECTRCRSAQARLQATPLDSSSSDGGETSSQSA